MTDRATQIAQEVVGLLGLAGRSAQPLEGADLTRAVSRFASADPIFARAIGGIGADAEQGGEPENVQEKDGEAFEFDAVASVGTRRLMWHPRLCKVVWEELEISAATVDLSYLNARGGIPFFREHCYWWGAQLGKVTSLDVEPGKITARKIRLSRHDDVKRYRMDVADGLADGVSLGYRHLEYTLIEQDGDYPICRVTKIEPVELSATSMPADAWGKIVAASVRSHFPNNDAPESLAVLQSRTASAGGDTATRADITNQGNPDMTTPASALDSAPANPVVDATVHNRSEQQPPAAPLAPIAPEADATKTLLARSAEFVTIARSTGISDEVLTRAIADPTMTVERFKAQGYDAFSTRKTSGITGGDDVLKRADREQALVDAMSARILGRSVDGAASIFARHSFADMAIESLRMGGDDTIDRHISAGDLMKRSMHVTSDFGNLLNKSVSAALIEYGTDTDETFVRIAKRRDVTDFRDMALVDFDNMPRFRRTTEGGEIRRGTIYGSRATVRAHSYWVAMEVTRQAFKNDGFGVLQDIMSSAASVIPGQKNDLVYDAFLIEAKLALAADELTEAERSVILIPGLNVLPNGTALNEAGLNAAIVAMTTRRRRDGGRVTAKPKFLLHGPELRTQAIRETGSWTPAAQKDIPVNTGIIPIMDQKMPGKTWALISDPEKGVPAFLYGGVEGEDEVMTYDWQRVRGKDGYECEAGFDFHGSMVSSQAIVASLDAEAVEAAELS